MCSNQARLHVVPIAGFTLFLCHSVRSRTGVLQNVSDTVVAVVIPDGAHHIVSWNELLRFNVLP